MKKKLLIAAPICALLLWGATSGNIQWTQLRSDNRHGTDSKGQSSDGTGTSGNLSKYNSGGGLSDAGGPIPATLSAVSHFFVTAYNSAAGTWTTAQPAFTDLTGNIATSQTISGVNAQTGTSYTFVDGDRDKLVTFTNASSIAGTLPQAGASSQFISGWFAWVENRGAGTLTITPATSTIDGASSLTLATNQGIGLFGDGSNYFTKRGRPDAINLAASGSGGVTGILPVANGGSGTSTPSLVSGTNVTISGTWPNQTVTASGGGGGGISTQTNFFNQGTGSSRTLGTVFQNTTGSALWVSVSAFSNSANGLLAFTDSSNPPTTQVAIVQSSDLSFNLRTVIFPVLNNNFYKVSVSAGSPTIFNWTEWH